MLAWRARQPRRNSCLLWKTCWKVLPQSQKWCLEIEHCGVQTRGVNSTSVNMSSTADDLTFNKLPICMSPGQLGFKQVLINSPRNYVANLSIVITKKLSSRTAFEAKPCCSTFLQFYFSLVNREKAFSFLMYVHGYIHQETESQSLK